MLLIKNPQFLPNHNETLSNYGTHEYLILTKFRNDWIKIVDFLIKAYFCLSLNWPHSHCRVIPYEFKTIFYSGPQANADSPKNMLLIKNPQFLSNHYETLSK